MANQSITPSGREVRFGDDEIIVSKTNLKGHIAYCNRVFMRVSGFDERDLLGKPHSIIRHPAMPRSVFRLLWQTIAEGREIFAYVNNLAKNGDNYWVFAHVTPSFDTNGAPIGYHSNRRTPKREAIEKIVPLYQDLVAIESGQNNRKSGLEAAYQHLVDTLKGKGLSYDQFVLAL